MPTGERIRAMKIYREADLRVSPKVYPFIPYGTAPIFDWRFRLFF